MVSIGHNISPLSVAGGRRRRAGSLPPLSVPTHAEVELSRLASVGEEEEEEEEVDAVQRAHVAAPPLSGRIVAAGPSCGCCSFCSRTLRHELQAWLSSECKDAACPFIPFGILIFLGRVLWGDPDRQVRRTAAPPQRGDPKAGRPRVSLGMGGVRACSRI